jgi:hypothetical protein
MQNSARLDRRVFCEMCSRHVFVLCAFCDVGYRADAQANSGAFVYIMVCRQKPKRETMPRTSTLPPSIPPRGLNLEQASEYWGPSTFKKLMKLGIVRPIDMAGMERNIFDRHALDAAMSARGGAT